MKAKKAKIGVGLTCAATVLLASVPARADWRDDWQAFAAKTGDAGAKKWVSMISTPSAKSLDAAWKAFRGYDATSLIAAGNVPAELKPGLIVNQQNMASMPWLAKYLPGFWKTRLGNPWYGVKQIRIVPTSHYYMSAPVLAATKKAAGAGLKLNANGELLNAQGGLFLATDAGIPFVKPKSGLELNYLQVAHGVGADDLHFKPITMNACTPGNTAERQYSGQIWWRKAAGRTESPPLGVDKALRGAQEAGALLFDTPRDVHGLAGVRIRYPGIAKDDDFKVFIPTLRRTRTLTGTNGQDPLAAGLEFAWDEWRSHWSKTDPKRFDYQLVGQSFILAQPETGLAYNPLTTKPGNACQPQSVDLELRPVWILDIIDKTGTYQYKKQRLYIDKELYYTQYKEMYDRTGKLLRVWDDARAFNPSTGKSGWVNAIVANVNAKRVSYLTMNTVSTSDMNDSLFDIDQLRNR